jgi:hypothetical protein
MTFDIVFYFSEKKIINEFAELYLPNFKPVPKAKSSLDFERSKRCNKSGISIYDSRSSPLCTPESSRCSRTYETYRLEQESKIDIQSFLHVIIFRALDLIFVKFASKTIMQI